VSEPCTCMRARLTGDVYHRQTRCYHPPKPKWRWSVATKRLFYDERVVADLRYSAATDEQVKFILDSLNAAEEKRR
jgi:hypothetical protein